VSAVDYLFKGSVESGIEPTHGMQSLDEAVRRRPNWSLAYAVRASARTERAMMSGRPEDAQLALDDARIAKSMLPNNTLASQVSLYAHLVAANVFSDVGDEASRAPALAEAGQDARALESATGSAAVQQLRAQYFEQVGMDDAALAEYQRTSQSTGKATNYASALYRRGAFVEAFKALEGVRVPAPDMVLRMYRACVVMELEDGYQRALEMFHQMMARPSQGVYALDPPWIPLLLGRQAEAVAAAQQSRERVAQMPPWMFEWYRHLLDYQCDMISAEELLAAAAGSRLHQCEAHFHIGLGLLAEGDRTGAREHFSAAVQTHVFVYYEYVWSRNFLARLEQDPTWPPWISVKEGNEATRQQGDETVPGTQPGDPEP
jgi:tetratricopeptide (TPR) repeat protein